MSPEHVAVIGLGYVGLPVALAAARSFSTTGFDTNSERIAALKRGEDKTREVATLALRTTTLRFSSDPSDLRAATFFIVAVPTPIDADNRPDLRPLRAACATIGARITRGACVVFESTVYPGLCEELCRPWIAEAATHGDFVLGYSPERINPGDHAHRLENIVKVIAGENAATTTRIRAVYGSFVTAGVYEAASIRVAEAAKVLENTQRDLNIALMNELAMVCERLGIRTKDVLDAAATKWNFLRFTPGLVGGHCIGVDPYYLTTKAEQLGLVPQVILAGRRINNDMGVFIAHKCAKLLAARGALQHGARVGVLGLSFKEDVSDLRNSRVPDIVYELQSFGCEVLVHDPMTDAADAQAEYGLPLCAFADLRNLAALVIAVPHAEFRRLSPAQLQQTLQAGGVIVDVKSMLNPAAIAAEFSYWSL